MSITTIAKLIRAARNKHSQKEFAQKLGVKQSSISRYESGKVNPSVQVIEHCMRLVHAEEMELIPTADELAIKIKADLAESGQGKLRLALEKLIEVLAQHRKDGSIIN
ncbi:MAG: transcriptional regulator [Nitrosomonadaceae bacterium]|nr:transcriptional regulator [Nitrosomonadaceae bacterium]